MTESTEHERVREALLHGDPTDYEAMKAAADYLAALEARLATVELQVHLLRQDDEEHRRRLAEAEGALSVYADEKNWFPNGIFIPSHSKGKWPEMGERARAALTPPPSERQPAGGAAEASAGVEEGS